MKKIICLYGGPGSGKSTLACDLFANLKVKGYNCELNREYIKEWVWEKRKVNHGDQTYFFAKQSRKERTYMRQNIDCIITDSPLVLTHFYGLKYDIFEQEMNTSLVMLKHHHKVCQHYGYKVDHIFLNRNKPYNPAGRFESEDEAYKLDTEIKNMLNDLSIKYLEIDGSLDKTQDIIKYIQR